MNELQAQLQEVTDQLAQLDPNNRDNLVEIAGLEQKKAVIIMKIEDTKAQEEQQAAQMVRIQAQEEKVESIVLPYDFDDIFENKSANEMIIEVVKEFQRKSFEDHNAEVERIIDQINTGWKDRLDELTNEWDSTKTNFHTQLSDLQSLLDAETEQVTKLTFEKKDSDSKRDAAVREKEETEKFWTEEVASRQADINKLLSEVDQLKSWNDDLRAQAAHGVRKAIDIIDISPSEKLALMVKETNEQKANRGLARWAEIMPEVVAPPIALEVPTFLNQTDIPTDSMDETGFIPIPADHQEVIHFRPEGEVSTLPTPVASGISSEDGQGYAETVTRAEFEALKATVNELCEVCNIAEVA